MCEIMWQAQGFFCFFLFHSAGTANQRDLSHWGAPSQLQRAQLAKKLPTRAKRKHPGPLRLTDDLHSLTANLDHPTSRLIAKLVQSGRLVTEVKNMFITVSLVRQSLALRLYRVISWSKGVFREQQQEQSPYIVQTLVVLVVVVEDSSETERLMKWWSWWIYEDWALTWRWWTHARKQPEWTKGRKQSYLERQQQCDRLTMKVSRCAIGQMCAADVRSSYQVTVPNKDR